jgi:peptide chain release factor
MDISAKKQNELDMRMVKLGISEEDLVEKFILGSGSGGQKVNKTSSCVYLKHIPTAIEVKCQQSRSRVLNRFLARRSLCDQLSEINNLEVTKRQKKIQKIKNQKKRRSRKAKEKMLEAKRRVAKKKENRKSPGFDN